MKLELDLDLQDVGYICNLLTDSICGNQESIRELDADTEKTEEQKQGYRDWYEKNTMYNKELAERFDKAYSEAAHHPTKEGYYAEGVYEIVWMFDQEQYKRLRELSKNSRGSIPHELFNLRREIIELYYVDDVPMVRDLRGFEYPLFRVHSKIGSMCCITKRKE